MNEPKKALFIALQIESYCGSIFFVVAILLLPTWKYFGNFLIWLGNIAINKIWKQDLQK